MTLSIQKAVVSGPQAVTKTKSAHAQPVSQGHHEPTAGLPRDSRLLQASAGTSQTKATLFPERRSARHRLGDAVTIGQVIMSTGRAVPIVRPPLTASPVLINSEKRLYAAMEKLSTAKHNLWAKENAVEREFVEQVAFKSRNRSFFPGDKLANAVKMQGERLTDQRATVLKPAVDKVVAAESAVTQAKADHASLKKGLEHRRYGAASSRVLGGMALVGGALEGWSAVSQFQRGHTVSGAAHAMASAGQLTMAFSQFAMPVALRMAPGMTPLLFRAGAVGAGVAIVGAIGATIADAASDK